MAGLHKLTITMDADVLAGLRTTVGPRGIGRFLSDLARPHVLGQAALAAGYAAMAADEMREREALEWAEATVVDARPER